MVFNSENIKSKEISSHYLSNQQLHLMSDFRRHEVNIGERLLEEQILCKRIQVHLNPFKKGQLLLYPLLEQNCALLDFLLKQSQRILGFKLSLYLQRLLLRVIPILVFGEGVCV